MWAPFAVLVPNPWFTVYICTQVYTQGHKAWMQFLSGNRSLNLMELHCQGAVETLHSPAKLPTSLMSKFESLLCFSDCGLIQGVPKSYWCITIVVGKSQPRNPKKIDVKNVKLQETIVQMWTWCLAVKVCSHSLAKLSIYLLESRQDSKRCNCHKLRFLWLLTCFPKL